MLGEPGYESDCPGLGMLLGYSPNAAGVQRLQSGIGGTPLGDLIKTCAGRSFECLKSAVCGKAWSLRCTTPNGKMDSEAVTVDRGETVQVDLRGCTSGGAGAGGMPPQPKPSSAG